MSKFAAFLVVAVLVGVSGCGGSDNKDPRKGRVYTHRSNCLVGDCIQDWKVCIGPNLFVHVEDAKPEDTTLYDSPECAP